MTEEKPKSILIDILGRGYQAIFYENWPMWLGGIFIGIMSVVTFAWSRPWGVVGGLRNWADWFFHLVGVYQVKPMSPLLSTSSLLTLGLLWGAFGSALMSKQFGLRMAPPLELAKGLVGGILMGVGSAMAGGCNVGGFYTALSAFSVSGLVMMVGLLFGAYLGLRYLYWEMEHFPAGSSGGSGAGEKQGVDWLAIEPYAGAAVLLAAAVCAWLYTKEAYTREGGLLLCGLAFGVIIQRTRFCFVRGFRDPFMTAEGEGPQAIAASLIISMTGFAVLKWTGLRPEDIFVIEAFWFGGLVGGIIFGFGMVVAGGCGSGSLWRAGEGQVKLMLAVVCFALTNSLFKTWITASKTLTALMGQKIFLPNVVTYKWSLILITLIMIAYYILAAWNEKTERFLVEL